MERTVYSIKMNRLKKSYGEGIFMDQNAVIHLDENEPVHRLYLKSIDAADEDAEWGRLSFGLSLSEEQVLYIYAFATNERYITIGNENVDINRFLTSGNVSDDTKKILMKQPGALRFVGKNDVLLYELKGRYLYIAIEVMGEGAGYISKLSVERGSDEFTGAFPEIYRENNDFFRRYMSVFNSIYNDFDDNIDKLPKLLDLDKCPDILLPVYAGWLGIDVQGDLLKPKALRTLVKEAYTLNKMKGTRACLRRILEIAVEEQFLILEANQMNEFSDGRTEDASVFDITVLIKKQLSETERFQLTYLLEQFIPVRSRLKLENFKDTGIMDSRIYLDMNAKVAETENASLDDMMGLDNNIILEE
ncbi:MAG: hypothetical protein IJ054_01980 [Lachnospiraceae bacterium]|mgnify:CR=1 FL=1|nr:hypothetical protein [Lachnospiraceae bacterium]MBQ9608702.1 hypothetical protein [Lachnospiraceae bacterium]